MAVAEFSSRNSSRLVFPFLLNVETSLPGDTASKRLLLRVGPVDWLSLDLMALQTEEQQRWFFCQATKRLLQLRHFCMLLSGWPSEASPSLPMPHPVEERLSTNKTQVKNEGKNAGDPLPHWEECKDEQGVRRKLRIPPVPSPPPHTEHE